MASDAPELIACPGCGTLLEDATAALQEALADRERAERDLRSKRAKISRLETDRWAKLRASKRYDDAMLVLAHWRDVCAPKAREIDSAERLAAVLARLNGGHTVDELKLCATGYAKRPYVTKEGRSAHGKPSEWYADAELIYRNPENVRRGIALAASGSETPNPGDLSRVSWRGVWRENRELIVKALDERFGRNQEHHPNGYRLYPCPKCSGEGDGFYLPLRVADEPGFRWLAECRRCGLTDEKLLTAIQEDE